MNNTGVTNMTDSNLTNSSKNLVGAVYFVIDDTQRIFSAICYLIASILSIFGNSLVILSVMASKKLWSTNNVFVVNLAVADLLTGLSIIWSVVVMLSPITIRYPIPDLLCAAASTGIATTFGCTLYTLASIAINRLDGITRPNKIYNLNYNLWMSIWVFITWLIPFLSVVGPPLLGYGTLGTDPYSRTCSVDTFHPLQVYQGWAQVFMIYPIPIPTICICYTIIFIHIRRHTKQMLKTVTGDENAVAIQMATNMRKRQILVTKNMFYIVSAFLLLLTPYGVNNLLFQFYPKQIQSFHVYFSTLVTWNSCVNPIIYGYTHPTFKMIFKCLLTCQWKDVPDQSNLFKTLTRCTK